MLRVICYRDSHWNFYLNQFVNDYDFSLTLTIVYHLQRMIGNI